MCICEEDPRRRLKTQWHSWAQTDRTVGGHAAWRTVLAVKLPAISAENKTNIHYRYQTWNATPTSINDISSRAATKTREHNICRLFCFSLGSFKLCNICFILT